MDHILTQILHQVSFYAMDLARIHITLVLVSSNEASNSNFPRPSFATSRPGQNLTRRASYWTAFRSERFCRVKNFLPQFGSWADYNALRLCDTHCQTSYHCTQWYELGRTNASIGRRVCVALVPRLMMLLPGSFVDCSNFSYPQVWIFSLKTLTLVWAQEHGMGIRGYTDAQ